MNRRASIIIPAWNEQMRISTTLQALRRAEQMGRYEWQIIVVDDGSSDETVREAKPLADLVISHAKNEGKGKAMETGWKRAEHDAIAFLDADLETSAVYISLLLHPIWMDQLDLCIAVLPPPLVKGGVGLVRRVAAAGISLMSGYNPKAPLSGQRACSKEVLECIDSFARGFGVEVGMTIDAVRNGFRVGEVEIPFVHRETGRDFAGWWHRGKQFHAVVSTLFHKRRGAR